MSKILMSNGRFVSKYGAITKDFNPLAYSRALYDAVDPYVVAHWSFDTDLVSDLKGSNTLTNNGGVTAVAGKNRSGAGFNGSSQYLSVADSDNWDLGAGQFTVGGWFNWTSSPGVAEMITHGGNALVTDKAGWNIISEGSNRLDFMVYPTAAYDLNLYALGLSLGTGIWHLVLVTRNAANRVDIWLDGVSIVNQLNYTTNINFGTSELRLGTSHENNRYFPGKMDEISVIKGFAASSSQILEMYNSGIGRFYSEPIYVANTLPIPPSKSYSNSLYDAVNPYIVAAWNFDKDLISDSKGSNTLTNNGGVTAVAGKNGNGASFNGSSQQLNISSGNSDFNFNGVDFSCFFWVNPNTVASYQGMINSSDGSTNQEFVFYIRTDAKIHLWTRTAAGVTKIDKASDGTISALSWSFIGFTKNGDTFTLYINGNASGTSTLAYTAPDSNGLGIGSFYWNDNSTQMLNGKLDEILIIKGLALSQSQITELYNNGQGKYYRKKSGVRSTWPFYKFFNSTLDSYRDYLKAGWNLNEASGNRADVISTNTLTDNGTVTSVVDPIMGTVASFDANKYLTAAHIADFNLGNSATALWTINIWYKAASTPSSDANLVSHYKPSANYDGWISYHQGSSNTIKFINYMSNMSANMNLSSTTTITNGLWYMITVVGDGTYNKLYVNGIEEDSNPEVYITAYSTNLQLNSNGGSWMTAGSLLCKCQIYNGVALSPAAITLLYNSGAGRLLRNGPI